MTKKERIEKKIESYKRTMTMYGKLAVAELLKEYIETGNEEECEAIRRALLEVDGDYIDGLKKKDYGSIVSFYESYELFGLDDSGFFSSYKENLLGYVEKIKAIVERESIELTAFNKGLKKALEYNPKKD